MKTFLLSILSLTTLLGPATTFAQPKVEEIEQYEIRSYDPKKSGLVDLVFEARIDNLTEMLNKTQVFNSLTDVSYKVYWLSPAQYKIEVAGLPKGFEEVKNDLATLLKSKLEFVIPEKFSDKFKGYTLKSEPVADGKLIKAIDDTNALAAPEASLLFDNGGRLKTIETKVAYSAIKTEFTQSPKAWSNNKLVLDKVVTTTKQGLTTTTASNSIDYLTIAGMGFPSKISVKNNSETIIPASGKEKEKKIKSDAGTVIRFSKYEVNTGKAQRFLNEGLRR